jgi:hypothetical protein
MHDYKLEYVISGCGRMQLFHKDMLTNPVLLKQYKQSLSKIPLLVKDDLASYCNHSDPLLSMLFNGFTEQNFVKPPNGFQMYNWLESDAVYADSGGLQMVTLGKTITPALKQKIYETQMVADYAMCFDVIPLTNTAMVMTRNERSNVGNKIFEDSEFAKSAEATAQNIKEQITYFKEHHAKTKVVIIVQGNTPQDMKFFYDTIASKLTEEDYEHVSGIAMADTCMGNGELESIKMLHAAHLISQDCHENVKSHIHFLGIGSLYRLRPVVYLIRSGLLKSYKRISYDSTSHTSCFDMGLIKLDGTCRSFGTHKTQLAEEVFDGVYNYFKPVFDDLITYDQYRNVVFGDREESALRFTAMRDTARTLGGNAQVAGMLMKATHTYYQIANFMKRSDDIWGEAGDSSPIGNLLHIRDERDIFQWYDNFETHVQSRPIRRREETATLNTLDW